MVTIFRMNSANDEPKRTFRKKCDDTCWGTNQGCLNFQKRMAFRGSRVASTSSHSLLHIATIGSVQTPKNFGSGVLFQECQHIGDNQYASKDDCSNSVMPVFSDDMQARCPPTFVSSDRNSLIFSQVPARFATRHVEQTCRIPLREGMANLRRQERLGDSRYTSLRVNSRATVSRANGSYKSRHKCSNNFELTPLVAPTFNTVDTLPD